MDLWKTWLNECPPCWKRILQCSPLSRPVKANADHCHCQRVTPGEGLVQRTPQGEEIHVMLTSLKLIKTPTFLSPSAVCLSSSPSPAKPPSSTPNTNYPPTLPPSPATWNVLSSLPVTSNPNPCKNPMVASFLGSVSAITTSRPMPPFSTAPK